MAVKFRLSDEEKEKANKLLNVMDSMSGSEEDISNRRKEEQERANKLFNEAKRQETQKRLTESLMLPTARNRNISQKENKLPTANDFNKTAEKNTKKAQQIEKTQNSLKKYNEVQNKLTKNTISYQINKNADLSEKDILEKSKVDSRLMDSNFIKTLASQNPTERKENIKNLPTSAQKYYQKQALAYNTEKDAIEEANKINEEAQKGNYLPTIGHVLNGLTNKTQQAIEDPVYAVGSLINVQTPTARKINNIDGDYALQLHNITSNRYDTTTANLKSGVARTASNISGTIGYMVPSILTSMMAPETNAGRLAQAISVAGSGYNENINEDSSNKLQSLLTGIGKGTASYTIEGITGGNILGKGSLDDLAVKTIASKTSSKMGQKIASMIYEVGGETLEEELENQVDYLIDAVVNNKGITLRQWLDEQGQTIKDTALSTLVLKILGLGGNTYNDVKQYLQNAEMDTWINEAEKIINKENLTIDTEKLKVKNNLKEVNNVLNNLEEQNLQQGQANSLANLQTQQTIQQENKTAQNQTSGQLNDILNNKELPMQSYQYEKSDNVKINNLRQDANKYFNNSEEARNYVNMLEKIITDKNIEIRLDTNLKTADGRMANGSYSNGVITINPNSTRTGEFIAIHELTHAIGTDSMKNIVETYRKSNKEFDTAVEKLLQNYKSTEITEEALSDISAQLFGNQEFINNIAQNNPNIFQKLYSEIKYLWHQFRGYKNQNQFVEDLYYKWTQAYNNNNQLNNTTNYYIETVADFNEMEYNNSKEIRLPKQEYAILSGIVNSDSNIKPGINYVETTNATYTVYYKETGEFKVLGKEVSEDYYDTITNGNIQGTGSTRDAESRMQTHSSTIQQSRTGTHNDEISNFNKRRTRISDSSMENDTTNNGNVKYSIQESENNSGSFSMQDNQGKKLSRQQQERYKNVSSKLKDENGNLKRYYHGTQRSDRVGNYFDPERATSGPMAFFTDNQDIAKNYSENKQDTSISRETNTEYDLFKVDGKNLDDYWNSLSKEQQNKIAQEGYNIGLDEDFENIVHEKNASKNSFSTQYDYYLNHEEKGNAIKALYDVFIQDGNLMFEDMAKFQDVLKYAGVQNVEYLDQYTTSPKVYEVYLNITNPFDTSKISSYIVQKLKNKAKTIDNKTLGYSADQWDKSNITSYQWIARLEDDIKNGTTHAWTSIPDWVTNVLKENGYDGIVDTGGKNGGEEHQVAIPFYSNQIKNIDNTNPTDNPDIRYSQNNQTWQSYLDKNYKATGTRTNLQDIKLPTAQKQVAPTAENNVLPNVEKYRTEEQIAKDKTITDLDAIKEASEQVNTPSLKSTEQRENQLKEKGLDKSPTIDYIKKKRSKEKVTVKEIKDTLAQKFVNKGHYIDKLANKTGNKKLTYLYDRTMNTFNEAQISIGDYQINSKGEIVGKSIIDIFQPSVNAGLELEFEDYLLNKHNISRYTYEKGLYGKEISAMDSAEIVLKYEEKYPEFKEWAKEVNSYNDNNLKDLVANGMINQSTYNKLKEMYGNYVPTYRDIVEDMSNYEDNSVGNNPIKRATQSDKDILSVKESMAEQTLMQKKAIRMNNLGLELYKTIGKNNTILEGIEVDPLAIQTITGDVIEKATDGSNVFTIFKDGEMIQFKISDELYTAFSKDTLQNKINNNKVAKAVLTPVEKLTKAQRELLTTYSIGFALNNPIKDIQDAVFNSKYNGLTFAKNYVKALYNIGTNGSWYQSYKNNGGTANTYFNYNKGILPTETKNPVKKFANAIKKANNVIEQAPRLAEYISTIEHKGTIDEALYNAAEVTTNFKRGGDITKAVNKYGFNFINASIQGLDKVYRNITGQNGIKGYTNLLVKATLYQIAPAILNGLLLKDDDDYGNLPEYIKDNYFLIKIDANKFFRIPKGRVSAVIGGIARRTLETAEGKDVDWKSVVDTAINQLAPNSLKNSFVGAPIIQAINNEAWYGGNIVSSRLQKLPTAEQYDESTDEFSKWLGEKLNISPKKINYVIDQYSGGIGDVLLPILTPQAENNILEDKFTTDAVMKNKNVSKYYSQLEELEKKNNSINATDEEKLKYKYFSNTLSDISDLYKKKREVQSSDLSDKEKRKQVKELQKQINAIVEEKLNTVENIKINGNIATIGNSKYYKTTNVKDGTQSWKELSEEEKKKNKNISLTTYANYKEKIAQETIKQRKSGDIKEDESLKNKDKILILTNSSYSDKEKQSLYENYIKETTDKKYEIVKSVENFNINSYLEYKLADSNEQFKADRKDDGTESGSAIRSGEGSSKEKRYNYILSMKNTSYMQKVILFGLETTPSKSDKATIVNYIISKQDKNNTEKKEMLKQFSWITWYKDGTFDY